jgi:hypothetical protein
MFRDNGISEFETVRLAVSMLFEIFIRVADTPMAEKLLCANSEIYFWRCFPILGGIAAVEHRTEPGSSDDSPTVLVRRHASFVRVDVSHE